MLLLSVVHNKVLLSFRIKSRKHLYISRRLRWARHVDRMEEGMSSFKILTGKPTATRTLGKPKFRWEEIIGMDLK